MKHFFLFLFSISPLWLHAQPKVLHTETDVLVIGGGTGGAAAAIQSARLGVNTILVEPTPMLGGMLTAAAVSCTDGNDQLPSGIWEEFRQALYRHYQRNRLNTGWVSNTSCEPKVGDSIFKAWAAKESMLQVKYQYVLTGLIMEGRKITGASFIRETDGAVLKIKASVVIDATELGDVLAKAGAGYDLGMDDPEQSGEKEAREKNNIIQDLTWAAVLKDYGPGADKTIPKPEDYDPRLYYCCCTDAPCEGKPWNGDKLKMLNYGKLPRSPGATLDKYMLNWPPHGNDLYLNVVELTPGQRSIRYEKAKQHTRGFIYFLQTELGMKNIGLADDEGEGGMALIPYNREGRRLKGLVRMHLNHVRHPYDFNLYRTGIAVGDYPVDHHHARYPGKVPELEFPPIPAYSIPMGTLIPENTEGLIVCEKGISVSNLVNGTTRLQPVVLLTGQAAGILAAKAVQLKKKIRDVPVRTVQEALLKAKAYLLPFTDVKPGDSHWEAIQKAGVTGILKGTGKAEGWANKMFFYPDSLVNPIEFNRGVLAFPRTIFPNYRRWPKKGPETVEGLYRYLKFLRPFVLTDEFNRAKAMEDFQKIWLRLGLQDFRADRRITRREAAEILNSCTLFFHCKNLYMEIDGKMKFKYSEF